MLPLASVQTAADRCDSEYLSLCRTRWITETTPGPSIYWPIYINTHFLSQVSLYFVALKHAGKRTRSAGLMILLLILCLCTSLLSTGFPHLPDRAYYYRSGAFLPPKIITDVIREQQIASCFNPACPSGGWWLFIEGTPILSVVLVHHFRVDLVADAATELPASCPRP